MKFVDAFSSKRATCATEALRTAPLRTLPLLTHLALLDQPTLEQERREKRYVYRLTFWCLILVYAPLAFLDL